MSGSTASSGFDPETGTVTQPVTVVTESHVIEMECPGGWLEFTIAPVLLPDQDETPQPVGMPLRVRVSAEVIDGPVFHEGTLS